MVSNEKPSIGEVWRARLWLFEVLGWVTGLAAILYGAVSWHLEADDRTKERHYRAWELINSARGSTGDGGRRDALKDLNEDHVNLSGAPLAEAYLVRLQLPKAGLSEAHLNGANLSGANLTAADMSLTNLSGANLTKADLTAAKLMAADLTKANLSVANLSRVRLTKANLTDANMFLADLNGAILTSANLNGAILTSADLSGADLSGSLLIGADLSGAKLENTKFCKTIMPDGTVNNHGCDPEPAPPTSSETPPAPN